MGTSIEGVMIEDFLFSKKNDFDFKTACSNALVHIGPTAENI